MGEGRTLDGTQLPLRAAVEILLMVGCQVEAAKVPAIFHKVGSITVPISRVRKLRPGVPL